jgi:hypothetical protein
LEHVGAIGAQRADEAAEVPAFAGHAVRGEKAAQFGHRLTPQRTGVGDQPAQGQPLAVGLLEGLQEGPDILGQFG